MLSYDDDNVGDWLAATTGDRLVLLPAADATAAARIWASLGEAVPGEALQSADDQGMRAVLDELTSGGLSRTPPFALLAWDQATPATVRVIVRGAVTVNLDTAAGAVSLSGTGISTWVERSLEGVNRVDVRASGPSSPADPAALTLPLISGMVRTRRLQADFVAAADSPVAAAPAITVIPVAPEPARIGDPPTPASTAAPAPATTTAPAPLAVPARTTAQPVAPAVAPAASEPASEQTITDIRPAGDDAATPAATATPSDGYDHLFGATVMRGVEQAAVRPESEDDSDELTPTAAVPVETDPDPESELDEPGDHDGHTVMSGDIQKLRDSQRRKPTGPAAAAAAVAPRLYLLLPSGTREPLSQPIRVGRAPSVSKMSGDLVPRLVSLGGADQDVSRNHVHFTVEGDTVVVTDLHSRNGTLVVLPGKPAQKLRQGEPTAVIVGTVVDLGSGITITVGQE